MTCFASPTARPHPLYVPTDYQGLTHQDLTVWTKGTRWHDIERVLLNHIGEAQQLLGYPLQRHVHLVIYDSNEAARTSLQREVPPTMLMAPLHTEDMALIVLQSPEVHPLNGDMDRMSRHIAHELGHVLTALKTGSTKHLGDHNENLKLSPWVDEGFAENLSAILTNQPERLLKARAIAEGVTFTPDELDAIFCDLLSPQRSEASAVARTLVAKGIEMHGLRFVFDHLDSPKTWLK